MTYGVKVACSGRLETTPVLREEPPGRYRLTFDAATIAVRGEKPGRLHVIVRGEEARMLHRLLALGDIVYLAGRLHLATSELDAWIVQPETEGTPTADAAIVVDRASAAAAIAGLLGDGPLSRKEIGAELSGYRSKTIEQALTRERRKGTIRLAGGAWSLADDDSQPEPDTSPGSSAGMLTLPQAAKVCGLALSSLQQAARIGRLRTEKPSPKVRLTTRQWLREYLDSRPEWFLWHGALPENGS